MTKRPIMAAFYSSLLNVTEQTSLSLAETCAIAKKLGYQAVDICDEFLTAETASVIKGAGLEISLIFSLLHFDESKSGASRQCDNLIKLAEKHNATLAMPLPMNDEHYDSATKSYMYKDMRRVSDAMLAAGKSAVLEIFDFPGETFSYLSGLLAFTQEVPGLKICFDTGNFIYSGTEYMEAYPQLKHLVAHVHLKDRIGDTSYGDFICNPINGAPPLASPPIGDGFLNLKPFVKLLIQDGYNGFLTVEHACCRDQLMAIQRSADNLKKWLDLP